MIVTFTPNPSVDRTATLGSPPERGGVNRILSQRDDPGGKGINVSRALHLADVDTLAVLPAPADHPLLGMLEAAGVRHHAVPVAARVRTNITLAERDGTTTKLNEPGTHLDEAATAHLVTDLVRAAEGADWVVLCGSLPPGPRDDWYADLVVALRATGARIAVDTSDAPLVALADRFGDACPDLIKPNAFELAQLTGVDGAVLESCAAAGDYAPTVGAARTLLGRGLQAVLATLGASGAVLVTSEGAWAATSPTITPLSTVGAGDSSLAGYLLAEVAGHSPDSCLRTAVAYGAAATALPGTTVPRPDQTDPDAAGITAL